MRARDAVIFSLLLAAFGACSKKRDHNSGNEPAAATPAATDPGAGATPPAPSPPPPEAPPTTAFSGTRGRLAPEQFSAMIRGAFQLDQTVSIDAFGLKWDKVTERYGVQLGGVDFESTFYRDGTPTAQMVLAARAVALDTAYQLVYRDKALIEKNLPPVAFTLSDLNADRPFAPEDEKLKPAKRDAVRAGEARWRAQLDDFFWKLLSRAPSEADVAAARETYLQAWRQEKGSERRGWVIVLYGLLNSAELWAL